MGEDRWESSWAPSAFLDVPSGTAAVFPLLLGNAKGRLLSRARLAAHFALFCSVATVFPGVGVGAADTLRGGSAHVGCPQTELRT